MDPLSITPAGIYVVERCRYLAIVRGGEASDYLEVAGREWRDLSAAEQAVFAGDRDDAARAAVVER